VIRVTRPADAYANATQLEPTFNAADGNGALFGTVRADPDGTNNAARKKVIVNR